MDCKLNESISWVGHVDWTIRDFHGYNTSRGSTYNAYLIQDESPTLVDTVKAAFAPELIRKLSALGELSSIRYLVCNHAEPDHSGSLPRLVQACPHAEVVCNEKCRTALGLHYDTAHWKFRIVKDGETLRIGKRTLQFIDTPMVHWPESMFTYVPEDRLLFSMDAFGQHVASSFRFDDQNDLDMVLEEAKTYYANIVMLYAQPIRRTLERAASLPIDMVAPSHGVIWRTHFGKILAAYKDWVLGRSKPKVLIVYDTMWQSTERLAQTILEGAQESNVDARVLNARTSSLTEIATESLDAAVFAFGSPTLNQTLMPQMAAVLSYLKGLKPSGKSGFAFGSYGWAKGAATEIELSLKSMNFEMLRPALTCQFKPGPDTLEEAREAGRMMARKALSVATQ